MAKQKGKEKENKDALNKDESEAVNKIRDIIRSVEKDAEIDAKQIKESMGTEASSDNVKDNIEKFDDFVTKGDRDSDEEKGSDTKITLQLAKDQNNRFFVMTSDEKNPQIIARFQ